MTKRRPVTLLPAIHQTTALTKFFGSTVDHLFQPGRAEPVSGYIGRVPPYNNPITDFYKQEPTRDRAKYQLEASMATFQEGELTALLPYDDLVSKLASLGAITNDPERLFRTRYWSWAPPIDIDKINNFQQWYWSGNDVPALDITLPGMDVPLVHRSTGSKTYDLPIVQELFNLLPEHANANNAHPTVLVNGSRVSIASFTATTVTLTNTPPIGAAIEVYRYGSVSDGLTTDYPVPAPFGNIPFSDSDIHVYVNGREITEYTLLDDSTRVRLDISAAINSIVTVTIHESIADLTVGEAQVDIGGTNPYLDHYINGLKVRFIDPSVFFTGFDVKPYDTFKWDEGAENQFYVEGVGVAIRLTSAQTYQTIDPQYTVCSRLDPVFSYWSQANRWVNGQALDWFNGRTASRQAKRPICEYQAGLQLYQYGKTRAPEVDLIVGITETRTITQSDLPSLTDDNGIVPRAGDLILFGSVGNALYDDKIFRWAIDETDAIILELVHTTLQGDVAQYATVEYMRNGEWELAYSQNGTFPLFELYDSEGIALSDIAMYPETTFTGSRIFCYEVGEGNADAVLGFPVRFDTYGSIMFENDLYTRSYQYRDGDIKGYLYYSRNGVFENQWHLAQGDLPEAVVPLNLQANPNYETPLRISKNNWFAHFSSIVTNQIGFEGTPYTLNNWADTAQDLSLGTEIIQSRAPMLKLMLLMSEQSFDLGRSITFVEREYTRLKLKIAQQLAVGLQNGSFSQSDDPSTTLITILKKLCANKSADFPFSLSDVGGNLFIPITPSVMGIMPVTIPHIGIENGDPYIVGHDGSKTLAVGDVLSDQTLLAFENLLYEYADRSDTLGEIPMVDLLSGKWRTADYSREEVNQIMQASFENWARDESLDFQTNETHDDENPFTWNYSGLTDRSGDTLPGHWRAIYRHYFDTENPAATPWEMLGFNDQPDWWDSQYGAAPYLRNNPMWIDLQDGVVRSGDREGVDERFARPDLMDYLPIDPYGELLDPVVARIVDREPTLQIAKQNWVFGDGSPIETLWRRSSHFGFAMMNAIFLMRPAQTIEYFWDTGNQILVHDDQWVDATTLVRTPNSEIVVHGEVRDDVTKISTGLQNYLSEYLISLGQTPAQMGDMIRGLDVRLMHKMAGFTTIDRMTVSMDSIGPIPQDDIVISMYRSPSVELDIYSGVIIEYLAPYRWRVVGYHPTTPVFMTRVGDPNGKKRNVIDVSDERIVNPWVSNVYYRVGMYVAFNESVYRCVKPHVSGSQYEPQFWELDTVGVRNTDRIYQYLDWDQSYEAVPYGTVMHSVQDVVSFLFNYERDLTARGFTFPEASWREAAIKFINWATVDWDDGAFITLSPAGRSLEYQAQHGFIMDLNDPFGRNTIVNRTGHAIDHRNLLIDRHDDMLSITATGTDDIYGAVLKKSSVEHALVFSNRTIFDDIIYDPVFNVRQDRLKLSARVTTDWNGRYDAPGFVISGNTIVSNFDKSSEDIRYAFDIERADNSVLRDHARHLIGFEKRDYLSNLLLNDTQQFELYQGMIQQKGAIGAMDKIMRSKAVEGNRDVVFAEEWAFRMGEFGPYEPRVYQEISLTRNDIMRQNQLIHFGDARVDIWKKQTPYGVGMYSYQDSVLYRARETHVSGNVFEASKWNIVTSDVQDGIVNVTPNSARWITPASDYSEIVQDRPLGYPTAGYIRTNEATYSSVSKTTFAQTLTEMINTGSTITVGENLWTYNRDIDGWGIDYIDHPSDDFSIANLVPEWSAWINPFDPSGIDSPNVLDSLDIVDIRTTRTAEHICEILPNTQYRLDVASYLSNDLDGSVMVEYHWSDATVTTQQIARSGRNTQTVISPNATSVVVKIVAVVDAGLALLGDISFQYDDAGLSIVEVINGDEFNNIVGTRFVLSGVHNFAPDDLVIINQNVIGIDSSGGIYEITECDDDWIEITPTTELVDYDFAETEEVGPSVYRFTNGRFDDHSETISSSLHGKLVYIDDVMGSWAVYRYPNVTDMVRQEPTYLDAGKIASALIYEKNTRITDTSIEPEALALSKMNVIDPIGGLVSGIATREIDYIVEYDPAGYDTDELWTDQFIGRVWWDISTTWFINPLTDRLDRTIARDNQEIDYRTANWNRLAPNTEIALYEWTRSLVAPDLYDGVVYDSDLYVVVQEYEPTKSSVVSVYYFWVKNPQTVPDVDFRKLDLKSVSGIIANPTLAGLPWIAPISETDLLISQVGDYLNDSTSVLQVQVQATDMDEERPHREWKLIRPLDNTPIPDLLWNRLRDSLTKRDPNGNAIPHPDLNQYARVGISNGQSMFEPDDVVSGRNTFITKLNYILATKNIDNSAFDPNDFSIKPAIPEKLFWVKGNYDITPLPPETMWDSVVYDPLDLDTELATNPTHRVLLDNRNGDVPSWSLWENGLSGKTIVQYRDIVDNASEIVISDYQVGDLILVREYHLYDGKWAILRVESGILEVVWTQPYDTSSYWEYSDWYSEEYSFENPPVVVYSTFGERNQKEINVTNQLVKVLDNGMGYWVWTAYVDGSWVVVARQDGVVQLKESLTTTGDIELSVLIDLLVGSNILTLRERNDLWFTMVNFIHSRNDHVDWAFKTSFLSILGFNEELLATPVVRPDNTADILRYIDEVKPYRVTVREFTRNFTARDDINATVTDFDRPLYYDEALAQYRRLDDSETSILSTGRWRHWYENRELARRTTIEMKLDRVWWEDTPDSGAAARIMDHYNPVGDMPARDLNVLLDLGFRGTIQSGGEYSEAQSGTITDANGILSDLTEGYRLLDPRVAPNTPEELVRLGSHDVFQLRARDRWSDGAPDISVHHFDVSGETGVYVADIDMMARDLLVYLDGKRVVDYTHQQFAKTVSVDVTPHDSLAIYAFGYAAETHILSQHYGEIQNGAASITISIPDETYSVEATLNGLVVPHTQMGTTVSVTGTGGDVIVTVMRGSNDSTNLRSYTIPNAAPVVSSNTAVTAPLGTMLVYGPVYDLDNDRAYSYSNTSMRIHNLVNGSSVDHSVTFLDNYPNSDLILTRDMTTLSGSNHYRAIQVRDSSMTVLYTIGQTGTYTGSVTMDANRIPADATVIALGNRHNGEKAVMAIWGTRVEFFTHEGQHICGYDDFQWGSDGSITPLVQNSELMSFLVTNPDRLDIIEIPNLGIVNIKNVGIDPISALGTIDIQASMTFGPYGAVLFLHRQEGGDAVVRYDLLTQTIEWVVWSGHMGHLPRFALPESMSESRCYDSRNVVWSVGGQIYRVTATGQFDNFANSTSTIGQVCWDEQALRLYVRETNTLMSYSVRLTDARFQATYQLTDLSSDLPLSSSMIIDRDGYRIAPSRMLHIRNVREIQLPVGIQGMKVRDDTGTITNAVMVTGYETVDEILNDGLGDRYVIWNNTLVLLDQDAKTRSYIAMGRHGRDTAEYTISDTGLLTYWTYPNETIRVSYWENADKMEVRSWVIDPTSNSTYSVEARDVIVSQGGRYLTPNVDYDIVRNSSSSWGFGSFDVYNYSSNTISDIVIRDTGLGRDGVIVITELNGQPTIPEHEWQLNTKTLGDRFATDQDGMVIDPSAWEIQSIGPQHGGVLVGSIPATMTLDTLEIARNDLPVGLLRDTVLDDQGVVWIDSEAIEYLSVTDTPSGVVLSQLRRGSRGTPITHHDAGARVYVGRPTDIPKIRS